jgi:hypothetical protein
VFISTFPLDHWIPSPFLETSANTFSGISPSVLSAKILIGTNSSVSIVED